MTQRDKDNPEDSPTAEEQGSPERNGERFGTRDLLGSLSFTARGAISDISLSGMAVETDGPLLVGQNYYFDLGGNQLRMRGRVRWCQLKRTERTREGEILSIYRAGLAFEGLLSDEQASLQRFISEVVELELERRVFGRFELDGDHPVHLSSDSAFEVERLSRSGMLVKANFAIATNADAKFQIPLDDATLCILGRVRSVIENVDESSGAIGYHLGVQFLPESEAELEPVIEYLAKHFGRLKDDGPQVH